jgi:DNA-binding response OmpR family regulator
VPAGRRRSPATLRGKIEAEPHHPSLIQTIPDIGYRFETPNLEHS